MARWYEALNKTRRNLLGGLFKMFGGGRAARPDAEELEHVLLRADIAPRLALDWVAQLSREAGSADDKKTLLRALMMEALAGQEPFDWNNLKASPAVVLVVGINGSGKTTTCAKLALSATKRGKKTLLAATDTFRAAGADQLRIWAQRVGCEVVAGKQGADAAAVAYDALEAAMARGMDLLLVDTAGRMHTKTPLMNELQKVRRAMSKKLEGAPHETWIVLDASLGQNAIVQARVFHEATPLTGAIVTKLDGSSKGGFIFSVRRELGIPIRMIGLGEQEDDLAVFDAEGFVDALLDSGEGVGE